MYGVIYALISAICWAINGIIYKIGLKEVGAFTANIHRTLSVIIYLTPIAVIQNGFREVLFIDPITALVLFVSAFFAFYLGDLLYMTALKKSSVSIALPISSSYPVFVVLLSPLLYSAKITLNGLTSALLVFLAVYILYGREDVEIKSAGFAFFAAISWAFAILSLDFLTKRLSVVMVALIRMCINTFFLLPSVNRREILNKNSMIYTGAIGGFLTCVGLITFITAVSISGSWTVVQASASSPVLGALLGKIVFRERIDIRLLTSVLLIVLSIMLLLLPQFPLLAQILHVFFF